MEKQLQKIQNRQLVQTSAPAAFSQRLLQCLINLDVPATRSEAKMEMLLAVNELMPEGRPDLLGVRKFEPIREIVQREGKKKMLAMLVILVKDFCSSLNVVRNMNEDQMIEVGAMLLEECENFRMEDYVMMFAMAKQGKLVKIYDRIDMQVITDILDEYWRRRKEAGEKALEEEYLRIENSASANHADRKSLVFDQKKGYVEEVTMDDRISDLAGAIGDLKSRLTDCGLDKKIE